MEVSNDEARSPSGIASASPRARGAQTQNRILERAVHIASVEGLSAMSLATLAKATSMSKSGLFAHFRSKEALQLAIIDEAERIFLDAVVRPSKGQTGAARLSSLVRTFVGYCADNPFEGGCFFCAAAHEFDGRPGAVRDRIAQFLDGWSKELRAAAGDARRDGALNGDVDDGALVFEVVGLGFACNYTAQLNGGRDAAVKLGATSADALLNRILR